MDDQLHHNNNLYGIPDLSQLIIPIQQPSKIFSAHRDLPPPPYPNHYDMMQMSNFLLPEPNVNTAAAAVASPTGFDGGDGGSGRWPRQETLTLLEIRSRLDPKFKETNQKGPLWDQVSRIMSKEYGYQRSGKKCKEKLDNLYKYYKKTKECNTGRQDGKHYRFFRQLEALYGETSISVPVVECQDFPFHCYPNYNIAAQEPGHYHPQKLSESLSFDTCSRDDYDIATDGMVENGSRKKRRGGSRLKVKIKEFIDVQMRKLMERQEMWLDNLTKTLEQKEQQRTLREEEWRRHEVERMNRKRNFWAKEREWIQARDAALMEVLQDLNGKHEKGEIQNCIGNQHGNGSEVVNNYGREDNGWGEVARLIKLRSSMASRFQNSWFSKSSVVRRPQTENGSVGEEKCDEISNLLTKKENSRSCDTYYTNDGRLYNPAGTGGGGGCAEQMIEQGRSSSPTNSNIGNAADVSSGGFPFLMADGDSLWENIVFRLN